MLVEPQPELQTRLAVSARPRMIFEIFFFMGFLLSELTGFRLGSVGLLIIEALVERLARVKFLVCPARGDLACVEYQNTIRVLDRAEAVSDDQHGAVFGESLDCGLDRVLTLRIECRSWLIEDDDWRGFEKSACYGTPLALAC